MDFAQSGNNFKDLNNYINFYADITDSLPNKIIPSDTVTNNFVDSIRVSKTKYQQNEVKDSLIYYQDNSGWWVIYNVSNSWIRIPLPFIPNKIDLVNIDSKGKSELVTHGGYSLYGSGGGSVNSGIAIFSLDSLPTLIFEVMNYCSEESFGERHDVKHLGEGSFLHIYERKIKIEKGGVTIYPNTKCKYKFDGDCIITKIPSGHYNLINGRFRKQ